MSIAITTVSAMSILVLVLQDAFEVMLLPRRLHRRTRLSRYYFRAGWSAWCTIARRLAPGSAREAFLGVFGALSMVVLFTLWAAALIVGFGALEWAVQANTAGQSSPFTEQAYMSGVTFFTLGYGDIVPHSNLGRLIAVIEAGTGIGFLAVVIGYLPVLYQLFAKREAHVILLDARAGSPPTATTMLCRHAESGSLASVDALLRDWETWGADLLESHLSYPMLVYYRSQHDNQSWLAAMTAVMDSCALILVGIGEVPPLQARMTFAMGRQVVVEIARSFGVSPSRYDGGDRLPHAEFVRMLAVLSDAGLPWSGGADSEETLAALRATYEPLLDGLGRALLMPLPGFIGEDDAVDHWQGGPRGLIAARLIAQLTDGPSTGSREDETVQGRLGLRLRARLKRG